MNPSGLPVRFSTSSECASCFANRCRSPFRSHPDGHSRVVAAYMLFYATGSGLGALASTGVHAAAGWPGVCLLGAAVSALALAFWAVTLRHMPRVGWPT